MSDSKYVVVLTEMVCPGGPDDDAGDVAEVCAVHVNVDQSGVEAAIVSCREKDMDWSVWEIMPSGKTEQRAIVFKQDGLIDHIV